VASEAPRIKAAQASLAARKPGGPCVTIQREDYINHGWTRIHTDGTTFDEVGSGKPNGLLDLPPKGSCFSPSIRVHQCSSVVAIESFRLGRENGNEPRREQLPRGSLSQRAAHRSPSPWGEGWGEGEPPPSEPLRPGITPTRKPCALGATLPGPWCAPAPRRQPVPG